MLVASHNWDQPVSSLECDCRNLGGQAQAHRVAALPTSAMIVATLARPHPSRFGFAAAERKPGGFDCIPLAQAVVGKYVFSSSCS
jgi:hypothetical protein